MRRRKLVGGVAAAVAAGAVLLGGALSDAPVAGRAAETPPEVAAAQLLQGFSPGDTAAYIAQLEARVALDGHDARALTLLGLAYQQQARETGDPRFYPRSREALQRALKLEDDNYLAVTGLAALAASRHRFAQARALAKRSTRLNPHSAATYGILGDAFVELGRYAAGFAAFEHMMELRPSVAAYARISYARELLGDISGAIRAMNMAVAAAGRDEPAAWALVHLGNLYRDEGRLTLAVRAYREALVRVDGYPAALGGLARVSWWRGDLPTAAGLFARALASARLAEYAVGLGDVAHELGRQSQAEQAYAQAQALERRSAAYGENNQLETALFDLDHDRNVTDALRRARIGHRLRPSIEGEHVLAWALYKNGRCKAAKKHSIRALRLGTKDTGAMLHRSYIERCLGNSEASRSFRAKALEANPYALFTVGSPTVHRK